MRFPLAASLAAALLLAASLHAEPLTLVREKNMLFIRGPQLPAEIPINYLEAYCRAGSTEADWGKHTLMKHTSEVISAAPQEVRLRDTLADGVIVEHTITTKEDEVDFRITARNPGATRSEAHWAQPCIRLSKFLGAEEKTAGSATDYLPQSFVFLEGKLTRMPTPEWATTARYVPGQVWCPANVPRTDVNPRPLNPRVPSHGLIGCFSPDEKMIFATAFEPYQELFQGVIRCLHADFRLGGLEPGETKTIRGKIYVVPNDVPALLARYGGDFPEHAAGR